LILFALVAIAAAEVDLDGGRSGGQNGGGHSGEGHGCFIAPAGTTNCTGLTGDSCNNVTSLTVRDFKHFCPEVKSVLLFKFIQKRIVKEF
jgi:hypothetical protein